MRGIESKWSLWLILLLCMMMLGTACSQRQTDRLPDESEPHPDGSPSASATTLTSAATSTEVPEATTTSVAQEPALAGVGDTVAVWASTAPGEGAIYLRSWVDARGLAQRSDAVILGDVLGFGSDRVVKGDAEGDVLTFGSLEVEVTDVLFGSLEPAGGRESSVIRLELFRMPSEPPKGAVVLFLKRDVSDDGAIYYGTTHPAGVVVEGSTGSVVVPVYEAQYGENSRLDRSAPEHEWLREWESMSLEQVADWVRQVPES